MFTVFLDKKLNITDFKYRKGVVGELDRSATRGDEDRTIFVQDFDPDVAEEILEKMKSVTVIGLSVKRCEILPRLRSRDNGGSSRGGISRDGDRRGGDRRDGDFSFSRGDDRFNSRPRSFDRADSSPRRTWQSGR